MISDPEKLRVQTCLPESNFGKPDFLYYFCPGFPDTRKNHTTAQTLTVMRRILFLLALLPAFMACHEDNDRTVSLRVNGKAEKGPYLTGSEINLYELTDSLENTGVVFTGEVADPAGNFDFGTLSLKSSYARFSVNGRFLNETTGKISETPFTLEGIADLYNRSEYHVNILTHFIAKRIEFLLHTRHLSFRQANQQAQQELLTCLGMQSFTDRDVSTFSLTSGTKEAAILIITSAALLFDTDESEFTALIAELSDDFMESGTLAPERKYRILHHMQQLDLQAIARHLTDYYRSIGETIYLPDLSAVIPTIDE